MSHLAQPFGGICLPTEMWQKSLSRTLFLLTCSSTTWLSSTPGSFWLLGFMQRTKCGLAEYILSMSTIKECWQGQRNINSPSNQSTARCAISFSKNCFLILQQLPGFWQQLGLSHSDQPCAAIRKTYVYIMSVLTMIFAVTKLSLLSSHGTPQGSHTLPGTELQQTVSVCC